MRTFDPDLQLVMLVQAKVAVMLDFIQRQCVLDGCEHISIKFTQP